MTPGRSDDPDTGVIDELGVASIATALSISQQAVRKWRKIGIPHDRQDALRKLRLRQRLAQPPCVGAHRRLPLTECSPSQPRLNGVDVKRAVAVRISARRVEQTRLLADRLAKEVEDSPPLPPVRGYAARLGLLFALDFPVLTMAFVTVAQVSPLATAGSAIALSLFLVLGAHVLGGSLRQLATLIPAWSRALISSLIIVSLLAAVIGVSVALRLQGFEIDEMMRSLGQHDLVFGDQGGRSLVQPAELQQTVAFAAALVTIMATTFGIGWSYRQHGPEAAFARAESAYARALRAHASSLHQLRARTRTVIAVTALALSTLAIPHPGEAAGCDGQIVLALVDTTTAYDDQDRRAIVPAIELMAETLVPQQRLIIRTLRDRAASSRLLLDRCVPAAEGFSWSINGLWSWLTSNPVEAVAKRRVFFMALRDVLMPELQADAAATRTALVETIARFTSNAESLAAIWLFSDLLESALLTPDALLGDPASLAATSTPLPDLQGATVHVAGIGRFHDKDRRRLSSIERGTLVDGWSALIASAGGELRVLRADNGGQSARTH